MLDKNASTSQLASPHRLSTGKYLALIGLVGVGLSGLWYSAKSDLDLTLDAGKLNEPHKILIYAHGDKGIEAWVNAQILTTGPYAFRVDPTPVKFEATRASASAPSTLDGMLEQADEQGYGYIAIDLQGPKSQAWKNQLHAAAPELDISTHARWAVIRSDRRSDTLKVYLGTIQSGIHASAQTQARASLMQALFLAPELFKLAHPDKTPSLQDLPIARNGVQLSRIAWRSFSFATLSQQTIEHWPAHLDTTPTPQGKPLWIALPMQQVQAEPLSSQALLLKSAPLRWSNAQGSTIALSSTAPNQGWVLDIATKTEDGLKKIQCEGISGIRALAVKPSLDGQVVEIRRSDNGHQVFSIAIDPHGDCSTTLLGQTPAGAEPLTLGRPDLSGKSSWLAAGQDQQTLVWRHNSKTGKVTLEDAKFVRERWQWQPDGALVALTKGSEAQSASYSLERITVDESPTGLTREVLKIFASLEDAASELNAPAPWPELQHTQERRFGANLRQATYLPPAQAQ